MAAGGVLALGIFVLRMNDGLPWRVSLPGAVVFAAIVGLPSVVAFLAGRGRAGLYAAAGMLSIGLAVGLSVFGLVMFAQGVVWLWAFTRGRDRRPLRTVAAVVAVWVLGMAGFTVLFVHLDPRCATTRADGTVTMVPSAMTTGWVWDAPLEETASSSGGPGVVSSVCVSDVVTWAETAVSLAFGAAAVAAGWVLAPPRRDPLPADLSPAAES